jgi:hypothetical protein
VPVGQGAGVVDELVAGDHLESDRGASELTSQLVAHLLTDEMRADLERMLVVDAGLGMTRLEWLVRPARDVSSTSVKTAIDKLLWLRGVGSPSLTARAWEVSAEAGSGDDVDDADPNCGEAFLYE